MKTWTLVNPLVSNIDDENMSIVTNDGLQAAKVLYERLSKNFDKEVDNFRITIKRSSIPKHMEHTGGYGDAGMYTMVGGGDVDDYVHYHIKETRDGRHAKFDLTQVKVDKSKMKKFIKELNKYDKQQSKSTINAYSPDHKEFDEYSLDFSLNDESIEKLNGETHSPLQFHGFDSDLNSILDENDDDAHFASDDDYADADYADADDADFQSEFHDKYSPQFDQFGGGKKKRHSDSSSTISSMSSDSEKYLRRSKHLKTYVNDFTPTRIWTYHPYLYNVSKIIIPSFKVSTLSPYFYVSMG